MASNKATTLRIKNNAGTYNALYPITTKKQVVSWDIGEVYGPFILTLRSDGWYRNEQIVDLDGVESTDIVNCANVLRGSKEQMIAQRNAYDLIKLIGGIEPLDNKVKFVCNETPQVDIQVQVYWTR